MSLIVLAGLLAACGGQRPAAGPAAAPAALVAGTVSAGPVSPVSRAGQPDTRPVPGVTVWARHGSTVVAVAHTNGAGRYELALHPGTYVIVAESERYQLFILQPRTVSVSPGQRLTVDFVLDTGIR